MKKFILRDFPVVIVLGVILYLIDYNNLQTADYICIALSILAFATIIFNLVTTYIKEKKDV